VPLPPRQAPNAKDQTNGCMGRSRVGFSANALTTGIIMVVKGMLSMKAEAIPDTHKINKMATANLKRASCLYVNLSFQDACTYKTQER
jgi:hypothetical protein